MAAGIEYRTTAGNYSVGQPTDSLGTPQQPPVTVPQPRAPQGDGWALVSTCAADGFLFWTWVRQLEARP